MSRELRRDRRLAVEPDITWYRSDDLILGFCGPSGTQGVYRFWLGESERWGFCSPETKSWDRYHQKVFLQGKADDCKFSDIVDEVPPLPTEFPPPAKYHVKDPSEKSVRPSDELLKKIRAAPDERLPVCVVLYEDSYESALGDGIFRYFESAHLDDEAAKAHIDQYYASKKWSELYLRKVYLTLSVGSLALVTEDSNLSPFDHFTKEQIVSDLEHPEVRLDPWGKPY